MTGILVQGDNHFIVRGPRPDRASAIALARHWSIIQIGAATPPELGDWSIVTREFRENLRWAAIAPGHGDMNPEVARLLDEMRARGVEIDDWRNPT
jgi:hypothetical protein